MNVFDNFLTTDECSEATVYFCMFASTFVYLPFLLVAWWRRETLNCLLFGIDEVYHVKYWKMSTFEIMNGHLLNACPHCFSTGFQIGLVIWHIASKSTPRTQDANWTYIRRSEDFKDSFWTSYVRSIYVLCQGVIKLC